MKALRIVLPSASPVKEPGATSNSRGTSWLKFFCESCVICGRILPAEAMGLRGVSKAWGKAANPITMPAEKTIPFYG